MKKVLSKINKSPLRFSLIKSVDKVLLINAKPSELRHNILYPALLKKTPQGWKTAVHVVSNYRQPWQVRQGKKRISFQTESNQYQ